MSYGQLGDAAIPNRYRVEYAPTGRAACKGCGAAIAEGTPKLGEKVRSPWHDGFDIKWYHSRCFRSPGLKTTSDLVNFQKLKWADQVALYEKITGHPPPNVGDAAHKRAEQQSEMLWQIQTAISGVPKGKLKEALEFNQRLINDKDGPAAFKHTIADGLLNGRLPPCPWCKCEALEQQGGLIKCNGFMDGATACAFKQVELAVFGSEVTADATPIVRVPWSPHPIVAKALEKAGGLPAGAPSRTLAAGASALHGGGGGGSGGGASADAGPAPMDVVPVDDGESEDEEGIAPEQVMVGMSFAVVGGVKPSAKVLQEIIEEHGGAFVSGSIGDGSCLTHLISTENEGRKPMAKRAAKYVSAVEGGVPVVSADFVLALAGQLPEPEPETTPEPAPAKGGRASKRAKTEETGEAAEEDLGGLKVAELKERLAERGLDDKGKKADLLARLREAIADEAASGAGGSKDAPMVLDDDDEVRVVDSSDDDVFEVAEPEKKAGGKKRMLPSTFAAGAKAAAEERAAASAKVEVVQGARLRQRKFMSAFHLDGPLGGKLPTVAALQPQVAAEAERKKKAEPVAREMKPPIQPGSALLRVDPDCPKGNVLVYVDEFNLAYNAVLNSFDIQTGVNKFWKIQLLQTSAKRPKYCIFRSWGRVGGDESERFGRGPSTGGDLVHEHGEGQAGLSAALKEFHKQFREKAAVDFLKCEPPCQHPGGYNVTLLAGQGAEDAAEKARKSAVSSFAAEAPVSRQPCALPPSVQEFVELIHSEKMMKEQLKEQNIDLEKMPLGSISDKQVHAGWEVLREIADLLTTPLPDVAFQSQKLMALSNKFYNVIPHKFAREDTPPIIDTVDALRVKSDMVESLLSISQGLSKQLGGGEAEAAEHPADANYKRLHCELEPASAEEVAMVEEYTKKTHAKTHNSYRLKVKHVFRAKREGEAEAFEKHQSKARQLLWHGSRLTNWVGILGQGLRIAPPEAPVTGYMFGKGVYFADMVSKSANYCMGTSSNPTAVLTLCDVALGSPYERITADPEAAERTKAAGKHSCWGIGKTCPEPMFTRKLANGCQVPLGPGGNNKYLEDNLERLKVADNARAASLMYNEFIVYDTAQIQMKYVVVCDMDFSIELD